MTNIFIWGKRFFFFTAVNFLIVSTLFVVASFLMNYFQIEVQGFVFLLVFYTIIGMGGAFISLWISKWRAIRFMGVQLISKNTSDSRLRDLVQKTHHLAAKAGLSKKPDVGIYKSAEVNAFATGPSRNNSLVAVSTGLLDQMNEQEVEGVLAHEVAHIANGDMVTMSLIQGVVNVLIFLIAHLLSQIVVNTLLRGRRSWFMEYMIRQLFVTLLYIPGSVLVCFFSRWREYRADQGGARFAGRDKMLSALQSLSQISQAGGYARSKEKKEYSYLMINSNTKSSLLSRLFSTHPPIQDRISRLQRHYV